MSLKQIVQEWVDEEKEEGYDSVLDDLNQHGCQSGMVGFLVYYSDTTEFYQKHKEEISQLVADLIDSTGLPVHQLFKDWDETDPFANEVMNQNLLAWFGFEETAHRIHSEECEQ